MKLGGFFIALAFVLAACSGDPQPREPDPAAAPSASSTATPPAMPAQASEDSPEGAAAFVTYWVSLVNYSAVTGDTQLLSAASRGCDSCESFIASLADAPNDERPSNDIWDVSAVIPGQSAVGARVEVVEQRGPTAYEFQFELSDSQPFKVRDIRRTAS